MRLRCEGLETVSCGVDIDIDIHDKCYNKWFMSKVPQKTFEKDPKYKLKIRVQEVSAVQEYRDFDLDDNTYKCKRATIGILLMLTGDEVKHVTGKLKKV